MKLRLMRTLRAIAAIVAITVAPWALGQTRLICRLAPGSDAGGIAADYAMQLLDTTDPAPFALFLASENTNLQALAKDPRIVWVEDDDELETPENTGGSKGGTVAAVADREALYAENAQVLAQIHYGEHARGRLFRPVRIAILDNGLSPLQPRLWERVVASANMLPDGLPPYDLPNNVDSNANGTADEMVGHGTMVAGIVDMIAPRAEIVLARVADSDGLATAWSIVKGLAFAVIHDAEVANVSLGSVERIPALKDVLDWTDEAGLLVVAPIGNDGARLALFPAGYSNALCVAGLLPDDRKAPFSNWERTADACAPATGIRSTDWDGRMAWWSGTSFASPFVAAAIADCLSRVGRLAPAAVLAAVSASGDDVNGLNAPYRNQLGRRLNHGRLDALLRFGLP